MPFLEDSVKDMFPELFLDPNTLRTPEEAAMPAGSPAAVARQARLDSLRGKGVDIEAIRGRNSGIAEASNKMGRLPEILQFLDPTKSLADRLK